MPPRSEPSEIDGPDIVITAVGVMGSIEIVTPEGIDVDLTGMSIMGRRSLEVHDAPGPAGLSASVDPRPFRSWAK